MVTQKCCVCLVSFEVCVYSDAILVFRLGVIQTLHILSFLCFLSFWTWAFRSDPSTRLWFLTLSDSEVPTAPVQCFPTWGNLGPIYKCFIQSSVLCHRLKFYAHLAQLPSPPEVPSLSKVPGLSTQGSHIALVYQRRTYCWTLLLHVPSECPLQSDWYLLSVLWAPRFPVGSGPNY